MSSKGYRKYILPDGKIYHLNADFETGKEHIYRGRPVIDALGRFKNGKNVEYFLKAKLLPWNKVEKRAIKKSLQK